MKKLMILAVTALFSISIYAAPPTAVNEKVLQAFEKSFKDASGVVWHEYGDRFEVKFLHNAIDSRITYDADGNILRTIRYYGEEQLPLFVRAKLQKQYAGKKVFGVTELASEGELDYYIVLEDAKSWSHVKCTSTGTMEVYKKYKKA
jgi:hypothetical protein